MKSSRYLFLASALGAAASLAASAAPSSVGSRPVPVTVVRPTDLPRWSENTTVRLSMIIDTAGVPHDVATVGRMPTELSAPVVAAVAQWRFAPASRNGQPVATRVILPLKLIRGGDDSVSEAMQSRFAPKL